MEIKLVREQYKPDSTIGRLLVDGTFECFTLEDGVRTTTKNRFQTAIEEVRTRLGTHSGILGMDGILGTEPGLLLNAGGSPGSVPKWPAGSGSKQILIG